MEDNSKQKLMKRVWESNRYYDLAKEGSLDISHPGMKILIQLSQVSTKILDLGCGEGSRLNLLAGGKQKAMGVDISATAIDLAKKNYPKIDFIKSDLEKIPLKNQSFDLVYSAFVLEHLNNPDKVLLEAIRLLSPGGFLVLIAPNYGAPNRCSPPFKGSRIKKIATGFLKDFLYPFDDISKWSKVDPFDQEVEYQIDYDTTIEPYIRTLLNFIKKNALEIRDSTSCWAEESKNASLFQKAFRLLAVIGIYPFFMWGPHLVVVAQRVSNGK